MLDGSNPLAITIALACMACYALGGLRFRKWAVEGRTGRPRFSHTVETIFIWLIYSSSICFVIVGTLQVMRKL